MMGMGFDGCSEKQWHYHTSKPKHCGRDYSWCPYCYIEKITPLITDRRHELEEIAREAMNTPGAKKFFEKETLRHSGVKTTGNTFKWFYTEN